ncbi:MAG: 3-oxoacyl-[acyl-carrier-protein] reductase [Terriglobales bacterium]
MSDIRTALVTGASQGIGAAIAQRLAQQGLRVALAARNGALLETVAAGIRAAGGEAISVVMDVGQPASIKEGVAALVAQFGRVDVLVNNAGVTRDQLLLRMKAADWDLVLQTNLTAAFHASQAALPGMIRQRWGRIINIASVVGHSGNPGQVNYVASKAGLVGLTRALALEVASRQVTVNAVSPGFIATAMTDHLGEANVQKLQERIPLGRIGTPQEIAAGVAFLAGEEAGYITGQVLHINGGLYLG